MNEPIVLDVEISEQYDMDVAGNDGYEVNADSKIVINKIGTDLYEGEYVITPSGAFFQLFLLNHFLNYNQLFYYYYKFRTFL